MANMLSSFAEQGLGFASEEFFIRECFQAGIVRELLEHTTNRAKYITELKSLNTHFEQPLMPGASMTRAEIDFWASQEPNRSLFNWKFSDPPHGGAYISKAVHSGKEPITFVSHYRDDGAWQFLGDTMTKSGGLLVCHHHPIDSDPSLLELADLPLGWYAEREKPGGPWVRNEYEPEASGANEKRVNI